MNLSKPNCENRGLDCASPLENVLQNYGTFKSCVKVVSINPLVRKGYTKEIYIPISCACIFQLKLQSIITPRYLTYDVCSTGLPGFFKLIGC